VGMWLFDPCIPSNWNEFRVSRNGEAPLPYYGSEPEWSTEGVKNITLNGNPSTVNTAAGSRVVP